MNTLDSVISIDDGDAILMAQKLGSQLGMGVGISSGANLAGAIKLQNELGAEAVVVTVFPDDNKKYLTTDLLRSEPARPGYISLDTEFCAVRALKRVCILAAILRIASKPRRAKLSRNPSCPIAHGGSSLTPTSALCSHRLSEGARQAAKLPVSGTK